MDSVRFGRALGFGARSAAKALAGAVDAATAPNPAAAERQPRSASARTSVSTAPLPAAATLSGSPANQSQHRPIQRAAHSAAQATIKARTTQRNLASSTRRFTEAVSGPFLRLAGVLWLEMAGAFFGIFAVFAGQAAWSHRADLHATPSNHDAHIHFLVFLAMAAVFGYFCLSSFLRARGRERRR